MARSGRPRLAYDRVRARLDERAFGQHEAKDALAGAALLHASGVAPCPVLLVGATGTGKTLLARSLAEVLDIPFVAIDASQLVPDGYVGSSVSSQLRRLCCAGAQSCGHLGGLVFVDELDKLGRTGERRFRDQAAAGLLGLLNGDPLTLRDSPLSSTPHRTDHLMVVAAGAFHAVREEVRKARTTALGFHASEAGLRDEARATREPITLEDIRDHAELQPELLARFRRVATLDVPSRDDLARAARGLGELRALIASVRKRRRARLVFGASWFRRWAEHAAADQETSYRALHGPFHRVALNLMRAFDEQSRSRRLRSLLLTGEEFDTLMLGAPERGWLDARLCADPAGFASSATSARPGLP